MPGPKWHPNLRPTFDKVEQDYVDRSINRIVEAIQRKSPCRHIISLRSR